MDVDILVSNDDGVDSLFLHAIADALSKRFRIAVAAPTSEQSWIGRALSRRRDVSVCALVDRPWPTWAIDGTPTDCINIALSHLLHSKPMAVVSGINIGYNTSANLIYSSGTIAAAMEGAFWGLPAFAISQEVDAEVFEAVSSSKGCLPPTAGGQLIRHAEHAADWISARLQSADPHPPACVYNLNYPAHPRLPLGVEETVPALLSGTSLFHQAEPGRFSFRFYAGDCLETGSRTDRAALQDGTVSLSVLNFSQARTDLNG